MLLVAFTSWIDFPASKLLESFVQFPCGPVEPVKESIFALELP